MKQQNKQGLLLPAVWVLACAAAFLRRGLYIHATDARGLLIRSHPLALVLWAVVALGAALILLSVRKLDGSNSYRENFKKELPAGYLLRTWVIGFMVLFDSFSGPGRIALILRILGLLCVPALIWGGICRYRGKMPFFGIHALLCLFLLVYMVDRYQDWSGNPQLQDYVFELLATLSLTFFSYYTAAFEADMGSRRMHLATGLLAILFCGAALGRTETVGLYAAGLVWATNDLCSLIPPGEVTNHDAA